MPCPNLAEAVYKVFEGVAFPDCAQCSECCYSPWFLKEEYDKHKLRVGKSLKIINSVPILAGQDHCCFVNENRCAIYLDRPLDCRLYPLDIIEEDDQYWWCLYTSCPKWEQLGEKLTPLIPRLESLITQDLFEEFMRQISCTKTIYAPYSSKQYRIVRKFKSDQLKEEN